ncbi:MAG: DUF262 domain-containing protein [Thermodesulfobacteriota bacterium]|nr:DUF262 domain-containing protein [Thermodesulfobacteriota bacterium]
MENLLSTVKSVSQLIDDFEKGRIAVPEIQRDVVWKSDQVKQLIDSISNGFPCGSLILWEPREKDASFVKSLVRPERLEKFSNALPRYFLLDGQQRLTALSSVILKRDFLKDLLNELEEDMPFIYINLKKFPNEIEATEAPAGYNFPWVLYNSLFDGSLNNSAEYPKLDDGKKKKIERYVQNIRDYIFPVQIIRDQNYSTVAEIFTRVNSQGTPLTGAEIHLAKIVPHWQGITKEFRDYRKELKEKYYELDLTFLMRVITAIECNVPQIKKLSEKIDKDKTSKASLNRTWKKVKISTNKLIRILKNELHLDKSKYVISKNTLVPLVYYIASEKKSAAINSIKKFFLLAQLSEHYGGSADSTLRKDFKVLVEASKPRFGLLELVNNLNRETRQYYRGLKIRGTDIGGIPSKNVLLLLMYILMRKKDATDWGSARTPLDDIEPKNIQLHHIFPFDLMIKDRNAWKRSEDEGYSLAEYRAEVNDIANITFLSSSTNASLSNIPPSQYLFNETTRDMRKAHFIPEDKELWKTENFIYFLSERRTLIAKAITKFLR